MAILATGTSDPNFYARQAQATSAALSTFADALQQRRARQDAADQQAVKTAFSLLAEYPELADSPYGQQLREQYGEDHPEIPGLLDVISKRNQLANQIPQSGAKAMQKWTDLNSTYQADQQRLASLPDTTSVSMPLDTATQSIFSSPGGPTAPPQPPLRSAAGTDPRGDLGPYLSSGEPQPPLRAAQNVTLDLPNPEKLALAKKLQGTNPEMFPLTALQSLPPDDQLRASIYLKGQGYNLPDLSVVDQLKMLPEDVRGLEMVRLGMIPPSDQDTITALRGRNKLIIPPGTQAELNHQDTAQAQAKQNRLDEMAQSDKLQRERMQLADSLRSAAQGRTLANQKEVIDYRQQVEGDDGSDDGEDGAEPYDWKGIVSDSKTAAADWDKRTSAATKGLSGKKREQANADFIAQNGPRPTPVPTSIARQIASRIDDLGLSGSDADESAIAASAAWQQARNSGASVPDATKRALDLADPENRVRIDFSSIKDEAGRRAAVGDYAKRLAAGEPQGQAFKEALAGVQQPAAAPAAPGQPAGPAKPQAHPAAPPTPAAPAQAKGPSEADVRARVKALYPKATAAQQDAIVASTMAKLQGK